MIVIPVMLVSARDGSVQPLRVMHIVNDGTGTRARGNYDIVLYGKSADLGKLGRELRRGRVEDWPRLSRPPEDLVAEALAALRKKSEG